MQTRHTIEREGAGIVAKEGKYRELYENSQ